MCQSDNDPTIEQLLFMEKIRKTEAQLRVQDFLAALKTCWWPSGCCLLIYKIVVCLTYSPISILNFMS